MPFLLAEILNFQGSTHRYGVGSFSQGLKLYIPDDFQPDTLLKLLQTIKRL